MPLSMRTDGGPGGPVRPLGQPHPGARGRSRQTPLIGGYDERFLAPTRVQRTISEPICPHVAPGGRISVTTPGKGPERRHPHRSLAGIAVVAHVTEDDQHPEVRYAAEVHAREHGCMLILFAADVASSWSEPMPNQWRGGRKPRFVLGSPPVRSADGVSRLPCPPHPRPSARKAKTTAPGTSRSSSSA